jgi:S1-C subfamily serine protease
LKKTLYQILDVDPNASAEDIEAAYRRLTAMRDTQWPDANMPGLVRQAHEILSDPRRRGAYDLSLAPSAVTAHAVREASPGFGEKRGKWIVAMALVAGVAWWWTRREPPAPPPAPTSAVPAKANAAAVEPAIDAAQTRAKTDESTSDPSSSPDAQTTRAAPPAVAAAPPSGVAAAVTPPTPSAVSAPVQKSAETLFADVAPSVARVNVMDASGRLVGSGSGVVIDDGVLLTSCHVATVGAKLTAKLGETLLPATVALADEVYDLCRLSVPGMRAPPVPLGSVDTLRTGQRVYAIGAPQGLELTLSEGIVSALRKVDGGTVIQTTAPISPGSSGGGLFDASGRLVGVMTFQHRYGQNLNFALPADWIPLMRPRRASEPGWRASAVADQSQIGSPLALLVGRWLCRDWTTGRTGHYSFETDGRVSIAMNETREAATLRYGVSGKTLQIGDAKQAVSMAIEELTARKLILRGRERSIACERE